MASGCVIRNRIFHFKCADKRNRGVWLARISVSLFEDKGTRFLARCMEGGFIWALWHYPLLFILYVDAGLAVLVPSLIGFTASIVAMNYITNFIFERSGSILLVMVLHALNNTVSFTLISLYPETPFTIVSSLMAWAVVGYLEKTWTTGGWPRTSE